MLQMLQHKYMSGFKSIIKIAIYFHKSFFPLRYSESLFNISFQTRVKNALIAFAASKNITKVAKFRQIWSQCKLPVLQVVAALAFKLVKVGIIKCVPQNGKISANLVTLQATSTVYVPPSKRAIVKACPKMAKFRQIWSNCILLPLLS